MQFAFKFWEHLSNCHFHYIKKGVLFVSCYCNGFIITPFFFFNFCQAQLFCFVCWKFFLGQKYSSMGFWFKIFTLENNSTVAFFKNRSYIFLFISSISAITFSSLSPALWPYAYACFRSIPFCIAQTASAICSPTSP